VRLIGISGRARAGKDSCASVLTGELGFVRIAFADALKDGARAMFGFSEEQIGGSLKETVDARFGVSPRRVMQLLGTDFGRKLIAEDLWVRLAGARIDLAREKGARGIVVPDVRFPNEAQAVRAWGGRVWRVERPGVADVAAHESETALDRYDFDAVIDNDGTLADLRDAVVFSLHR
jgi:hypothetical protein